MGKFRSISDLQDFCDNEYFEPDTSETEPGQEVSIKSVYERCMRGELPDIMIGDYDIKGDMSIDDAFKTLDITQSEDFELADVTAISNAIAQAVEKAKEAEVGAGQAAPSKASANGEQPASGSGEDESKDKIA